MSKLYMGFDAGTQSVKVAVYDEQFNCLTRNHGEKIYHGIGSGNHKLPVYFI